MPRKPGLPRPYHFNTIKIANPAIDRVDRVQGITSHEVLTRIVQEQKASDIEERFARALDKNGRVERYQFQLQYFAGKNIPGEYRLDFMVYSGGMSYPIAIDGEYAHKGADALEHDRFQDLRLNEHLRGTGAQMIQRIPGHLLETQDAADALVREMF